MKELSLQTKILKALRARGGYWKQKSASMYEENGQPDIMGSYKGYSISFEVKRSKQTFGASKVQEVVIEKMKPHFYHASVIESVEEALKVLDDIDAK